MGLFSILMKDPAIFLLLVFPLLYSIIFHEFAHGLVAFWFGDKTAKHAGRLTLNPLAHLDPVGTIMLFFVGFGWAKPVPVNYVQLKRSRLVFILVALAGCFTNFLLATLALFLLELQGEATNTIFSTILMITARINIILGTFNLIPIPPLDGSKVLMGFLSEETQRSFEKLEPYGFLLIIILLFTGLLYPVINFMQTLIYELITFLL